MIANGGRPTVWSVGDPALNEEDHRRIEKFAAECFQSIRRPNPPRLYHYTDGAGLIGIISQGQMRASHVAYLNDVTEVRRSIEALREILISHPDGFHDEGLGKFLFMCAGLLDAPLKDPSQLAQIWVTCFSTQENQLSQWRAYGSYCIEFDPQALTHAANGQDCAIMSCNYEDVTHSRLIGEVAQKLIEFFEIRRNEFEPAKQLIFGRALFSQMMDNMAWVAPLLKHPAFKEEAEWRIYRRRPDGDTRGIEFVARRSMISGFINFDLRQKRNLSSLLLPITRVLVGPDRHVSLSCAAIGAMLIQMGYRDVEVVDCKVPFRAD